MAEKKDVKSNFIKTKILIVDDHMVVIEGIKGLFEKEPDFEIVGEARDGLEAFKMVKSLKPDIVIMDISMPNLDGIETTQDIKKFNSEIAVIVFTMYRDKEYIVTLFRIGVEGYVFKDESLNDLITAVQAVKDGGTFYSNVAQQILRNHINKLELGDAAKHGEVPDRISKLSQREKEIFPLLADGLSIKRIAERLCISSKTVETHKYNIMTKLEVNSIADLTKLAIKKDLIRL